MKRIKIQNCDTLEIFKYNNSKKWYCRFYVGYHLNNSGNFIRSTKTSSQQEATKIAKDIWHKFGDGKKNNFSLIDTLVSKIWYQKVLGMKTIYPLNLVRYVKKEAEDELNKKFGWQPFKHKHHESRFTRFYEDFWLLKRFGFDKRKAHFSSLIMTNQMSREEALKRVSSPEMDENFLKQEFEYVAHKLDLSIEELQQLLELPKNYYFNFKNKRWIINMGANLLRFLGLERRYFR